MDINIVPVTEAEMTGFFQRVTTSFVSLSRQAAELEEVKRQVDSLYGRVNELCAERDKLKAERDDALMQSLENETKLNDARRHRDDLEARVSSLNEAIIGRDSKVNELAGLLTSARLEAEDWQRKHSYLEGVERDLRNQLATVRERRDHFRDRAESAEKELEETRTKLQKVVDQMNTMSDILGIVKQQEQVKEVPAQPDPTASQVGQSGTTLAEATKPSEAPKPWWESPAKEVAF